jgi:16S rRNA (uracil1498-N3)-methyltransferase
MLETETSVRLPRFYVPDTLAPGALYALPAHAAHHAVGVLRLSGGDTVALFNGDGGEWEARIATVSSSGVQVRIGQRRERDVEAPLRIALAQGVSSRERMDFTLQKATELGVAEIWPIACSRSVVRLSEERAARRGEHWQNLVTAACEQCGRNRVPEVHPLQSFAGWLGALPETSRELRLLLRSAADRRISEAPRSESVLLLVGPEGGLSAEEVELAASCGFGGVRLGPRILRTETAALAALAALHALWGDF